MAAEPDQPAAADSASTPVVAESFERYRVIEKIGEGGCGVVYRAEQFAPVRREVALKVIKLGMDTRSVVARFEAERQALALMEHPHIARVFDAGATQSGRPFFAMELVRGEAITRYCDRRELPLAGRLKLFSQVCHAVQHAHQKGIIHRDLKPSNILVVEVDGQPVPKVIDFGVAKATEHQRLAGHTIYTAFDQFIGTPAYMSPEQAALTGEDIDTRSDIYSLGVLLYELLTGRPAFDPERLRQAALDEVCRIIREEEPTRPSARIATLAPNELNDTARRRLLPSSRLASQLRGDLDWVVMKALEKDRGRRYATANDLAADIQRLLAHEPVSAGPPTALYRLGKFARRNRPLVISATAVLLALLAGLALSIWSYVREKEARHWAETRAYASDMGLAARMAGQSTGLGGVARLVSAWQDRQPDPRGWEWYYLNGLCHQERLALDSGNGSLTSVAWSPDGTRLASGGANGQVSIWDPSSGARIKTLIGQSGIVNALAWNSDGTQLAVSGPPGSVTIWDVIQARERLTLPVTTNRILSLAWSPDGRTLATGCSDTRVRLWDAANGTEQTTLRGRRPAQSLSWSHDGSRLAAAGGGQVLMLWDVPSGRALPDDLPPAKSGGYRSIAWSPDDRHLAVGGDDFTIKLFNSLTGTNTATFWGHRSSVISLAWNADGTRLVSADSGDGAVRIWDVPGARVIRSLRGHQGPVKAVAWQPGGSWVASAGSDGTLRIWDANRENRSLRPLRHPSQILSLSWHPDGRHLAAGGRHDSAVIWDTHQNGKPLDLRAPVNWVWAVAWNPAGSRLATAGDDKIIRLWDPNGRETAQLAVARGGLSALAWSPNGARLAFSGGPCGLNLWDADSTNAISLLTFTNEASHALAWKPDGQQFAVAAGARIVILDATAARPVRVLSGHTETVRALAWSPDGRQLASAGDDSLARLWDAASGHEIRTLIGFSAPVRAVSWSPDGTRLAAGGWDGVVKLWDPKTGVELCSFTEHPAQVAAVAFSPDGACLASSDLDGIIYLRDATPGREAEKRHLAPGAPVSNRLARAEAPRSVANQRSNDALQRLIWYRDTAERFRHNESDLHSQRLLARFLADNPFAELRDGRRAVELGEQAATLSHRNNAGILDDLAAAYAEAGDFAKAVAVQSEAIALLNSPLAKAELTTRLRLYESNQPARDYDW